MTPETISQQDRNNAIISYCFLAVFMLISRQERYRSEFLRAHARYATLLHFGFLLLLFFFFSTKSLRSFILFDAANFQFSLTNTLFFVCFFAILFLTGIGIVRALRGMPPRFSIENPLKTTTFSDMSAVTVREEHEKIPLVLSHIPFLGIYLAAKYENSLIYGARWGTWATIIAVIFLWIDPSLFLFMGWLMLATLWLVYQSIKVFAEDTLHLMGEKLPTAVSVQIIAHAVYRYFSLLTDHDNHLPVWSDIVTQEKERFVLAHDEVISPVIAIPVINLIAITRLWRDRRITHSSLQGFILTIITLLVIFYGSFAGILLVLLMSLTGYNQILRKHFLNIPFLAESASICLTFLAWKKKKSVSEHISHTIIQ